MMPADPESNFVQDQVGTRIILSCVSLLYLVLLCIRPSTDYLNPLDNREDRMNDQKAIEAAISEFIRVYDAGDIDSLLNYYRDDMIKVRNGAPPENKSQLTQRLREVFSKYRSNVEVANDEIEVYGELAFTRGSFKVTLTPRDGGESQTLSRRYLEIWRKENGRWQVVRAMDNSD